VTVTNVTNLPVPIHPSAGQPLFIVIKACNGDGCGPDSATSPANGTQQVVPGPNSGQPFLATPISGTNVPGPLIVLSWSRINGDNGSNTTYRLFVNDLGRSQTALDVLTRGNFWGAYFKAEGSLYGSNVTANPPGGSTSPDIVFVVTGTSASAPTMVMPRHQDTGVTSTIPSGNILLGWTPVPGATLYEYFVAEPGQGATVRGVTPGLSVQVPLPGGKTFDGIVRACPTTCTFGSDANWGPFSSVQPGPGITKFVTQ
jgi:hypothetical protein